MKHTSIKPGIGLGELKFGMTREQVKKILGEPAEIEQYSYSDSDEDLTESWHYDDLELSVSFDDDADWRLMTFAASSEDYELFGKPVIGITQLELTNLLNKNGITNLEVENAAEDEDDDSEGLHVISEQNSISFWIEDDEVTEVQWGPEFLDENTVKWPD